MNKEISRKVLESIKRNPNKEASFYTDQLGISAEEFTSYSEHLMNSGYLTYDPMSNADEKTGPSINISDLGLEFLRNL